MVGGRRRGWALAAVGMLLVSTDSLFIRLAEADGLDVAFLVAVFSLPVLVGLQHRVHGEGVVAAVRRNPRPLGALAVIGAGSQICFITAVTHTTVSNVVVMIASAPVMAAVGARIVLGEQTSLRVWKAIAITLVGIALVVSGSLGTPNVSGDLLAACAVAQFVAAMLVWRRHPELSRFAGLAVGTALMLVITSVFASPLTLDPRAYLAAAAMGLAFNPAGRIAHSYAPRYAPPAEVALFSPIETIAAPVWAWLAFGEVPPGATIVGGVIVVAGVLYGTVGTGSPRVRRSAS